MKRTAAEKWAPCVPIVEGPSTWGAVAVTVQGGFAVVWVDVSYGRFPNGAYTRTWS
jgi:hypothetical protein